MSETPETQEAVERWQQGKINIFDEMARLERERDEAQKILKVIEQAHHASLYREGELKRERDEAREDADHWKTEYEIVVARLRGRKHPRDNGIVAPDEIIPMLISERDEARKDADEWARSFCAVQVQRDEARGALAVMEKALNYRREQILGNAVDSVEALK